MADKVDPRVLRTRKLIQDAFIELANEKGFDAVSVKDITERATINRATFYAHYEDKFALLTELTRLAFEKNLSEHMPETDMSPELIIRRLISATLEYLIAFHKTCRIDREDVAGLIDKTVRTVLQRTVASMTETEMAATIVSAAVYGAAERIQQTKGKTDAHLDEASAMIAKCASFRNLPSGSFFPARR